MLVNCGGLLMMLTLVMAAHTPLPSGRSAAWDVAGGMSGGSGLALFYRALPSGRMGVTAPIAAVLGDAIPTAFGMFTEGLPGRWPLFGFFLAVIGLWLITRTEDGVSPEGIG